ncbi:MAG: hypothetical protein AB4040_15485 [Synechococcus sp.]
MASHPSDRHSPHPPLEETATPLGLHSPLLPPPPLGRQGSSPAFRLGTRSLGVLAPLSTSSLQQDNFSSTSVLQLLSDRAFPASQLPPEGTANPSAIVDGTQAALGGDRSLLTSSTTRQTVSPPSSPAGSGEQISRQTARKSGEPSPSTQRDISPQATSSVPSPQAKPQTSISDEPQNASVSEVRPVTSGSEENLADQRSLESTSLSPATSNSESPSHSFHPSQGSRSPTVNPSDDGQQVSSNQPTNSSPSSIPVTQAPSDRAGTTQSADAAIQPKSDPSPPPTPPSIENPSQRTSNPSSSASQASSSAPLASPIRETDPPVIEQPKQKQVQSGNRASSPAQMQKRTDPNQPSLSQSGATQSTLTSEQGLRPPSQSSLPAKNSGSIPIARIPADNSESSTVTTGNIQNRRTPPTTSAPHPQTPSPQTPSDRTSEANPEPTQQTSQGSQINESANAASIASPKQNTSGIQLQTSSEINAVELRNSGETNDPVIESSIEGQTQPGDRPTSLPQVQRQIDPNQPSLSRTDATQSAPTSQTNESANPALMALPQPDAPGSRLQTSPRMNGVEQNPVPSPLPQDIIIHPTQTCSDGLPSPQSLPTTSPSNRNDVENSAPESPNIQRQPTPSVTSTPSQNISNESPVESASTAPNSSQSSRDRLNEGIEPSLVTQRQDNATDPPRQTGPAFSPSQPFSSGNSTGGEQSQSILSHSAESINNPHRHTSGIHAPLNSEAEQAIQPQHSGAIASQADTPIQPSSATPASPPSRVSQPQAPSPSESSDPDRRSSSEQAIASQPTAKPPSDISGTEPTHVPVVQVATDSTENRSPANTPATEAGKRTKRASEQPDGWSLDAPAQETFQSYDSQAQDSDRTDTTSTRNPAFLSVQRSPSTKSTPPIAAEPPSTQVQRSPSTKSDPPVVTESPSAHSQPKEPPKVSNPPVPSSAPSYELLRSPEKELVNSPENPSDSPDSLTPEPTTGQALPTRSSSDPASDPELGSDAPPLAIQAKPASEASREMTPRVDMDGYSDSSSQSQPVWSGTSHNNERSQSSSIPATASSTDAHTPPSEISVTGEESSQSPEPERASFTPAPTPPAPDIQASGLSAESTFLPASVNGSDLAAPAETSSPSTILPSHGAITEQAIQTVRSETTVPQLKPTARMDDPATAGPQENAQHSHAENLATNPTSDRKSSSGQTISTPSAADPSLDAASTDRPQASAIQTPSNSTVDRSPEETSARATGAKTERAEAQSTDSSYKSPAADTVQSPGVEVLDSDRSGSGIASDPSPNPVQRTPSGISSAAGLADPNAPQSQPEAAPAAAFETSEPPSDTAAVQSSGELKTLSSSPPSSPDAVNPTETTSQNLPAGSTIHPGLKSDSGSPAIQPPPFADTPSSPPIDRNPESRPEPQILRQDNSEKLAKSELTGTETPPAPTGDRAVSREESNTIPSSESHSLQRQLAGEANTQQRPQLNEPIQTSPGSNRTDSSAAASHPPAPASQQESSSSNPVAGETNQRQTRDRSGNSTEHSSSQTPFPLQQKAEEHPVTSVELSQTPIAALSSPSTIQPDTVSAPDRALPGRSPSQPANPSSQIQENNRQQSGPPTVNASSDNGQPTPVSPSDPSHTALESNVDPPKRLQQQPNSNPANRGKIGQLVPKSQPSQESAIASSPIQRQSPQSPEANSANISARPPSPVPPNISRTAAIQRKTATEPYSQTLIPVEPAPTKSEERPAAANTNDPFQEPAELQTQHPIGQQPIIPQLPRVLQTLNVLQPLIQPSITPQVTSSHRSDTQTQPSNVDALPVSTSLPLPTPVNSLGDLAKNSGLRQSKGAKPTSSSIQRASQSPSSALPEQWSSLAELMSETSSSPQPSSRPLPEQRSSLSKLMSETAIAPPLPSPISHRSSTSETTIQAAFDTDSGANASSSSPGSDWDETLQASPQETDNPEQLSAYLDTLAREVYSMLRLRLERDRERHGNSYTGRLPW